MKETHDDLSDLNAMQQESLSEWETQFTRELKGTFFVPLYDFTVVLFGDVAVSLDCELLSKCSYVPLQRNMITLGSFLNLEKNQQSTQMMRKSRTKRRIRTWRIWIQT